jgi:hypothetical protein
MSLSTGVVLVEGSGSFSDGVVSEVTWEDELDGSLDVSGGEGGLLLVSGELGGLDSDSLEDVVNEGVHDSHSLLGDTDVSVDVLENSVDVDRVGVELLLVVSLLGDLGLASRLLLGNFLRGGSGHD